jgi:transcriptional regulator with XRE-family HTH domain
MAPDEGPLLPRRRLGAELRRIRGNRTLDEVADATLISTSKLSRLENGQGAPQPRDIRDLIVFYDVDTATADRLRQWTGAGRRQAWWKQYSDVVSPPLNAYLDFEAGASTIRAFALSLIPGLLQTAEHAGHLLGKLPPPRTAEQIQRLIEIRGRRQELLLDSRSRTRLITVIDEGALHRKVGSPAEMHAQLDQLHRLSLLRNITIQILPFDAGVHAGLLGMFTVFQFADDIDRDIVSIETHSGDRYLEEQSSVLEYLRMFDAVSNKALGNDDSRAMITELIATPTPPKDSP